MSSGLRLLDVLAHRLREEMAQRYSGYLVVGPSVIGLRKAMPVYLQASELALPSISINGGRLGFPVGSAPQVLVDPAGCEALHCARSGRARLHAFPAAVHL